jgi:Xaa-Pro aminopeptidase
MDTFNFRQELAERRRNFFKQISENSVAILFNTSLAIRNGDGEYPFRPSSNFYYLTGFEEPGAVAVFIPGRSEGAYILFHLPRDPDQERWIGKRFDNDEVCDVFGVDQAFSLLTLESQLPQLLFGKQSIFYSFEDDAAENTIHALHKKLPNYSRTGSLFPTHLQNISPLIHELRLYKSDHEIELMRKAAQISVKGHQQAMRTCRPGMFEYQIEAELVYAFYQGGARFTAYPSIVASGNNACTMHYHSNTATLKSGDLVLVDAGAEYHFYASDITRTFPVNGKFTDYQRAIYNLVLAAQLAGIAEIKPGNPWNKAQLTIAQVITEGLLELGILKGNLESLLEQKAYQRFYIHNSGHWLGLDTHDPGNYQQGNHWRPLEPSMVLTVEPGIYIPHDYSDVDKNWRGIGIRIEDDVLVTSDGHEVLSQNLIKSAEEIEDWMSVI